MANGKWQIECEMRNEDAGRQWLRKMANCKWQVAN